MSGVYKGQTGFKFKGLRFRVFGVFVFEFLGASFFGLRFRVVRFPNSPYIDSCLNLSTMATASKTCPQLPK